MFFKGEASTNGHFSKAMLYGDLTCDRIDIFRITGCMI
jgi:hypothetical protein